MDSTATTVSIAPDWNDHFTRRLSHYPHESGGLLRPDVTVSLEKHGLVHAGCVHALFDCSISRWSSCRNKHGDVAERRRLQERSGRRHVRAQKQRRGSASINLVHVRAQIRIRPTHLTKALNWGPLGLVLGRLLPQRPGAIAFRLAWRKIVDIMSSLLRYFAQRPAYLRRWGVRNSIQLPHKQFNKVKR